MEIAIPCVCVLCEGYKPTDGRAGLPMGAAEFDTPTKLITCPRCGKYRISTSLLDEFAKGLPAELGLPLSSLVRKTTDIGRELLYIDGTNYEDLAGRFPVPRSYGALVDRILLEISARCVYPGRSTAIMPMEEFAAVLGLPLDACDVVVSQLSEQKLVDLKTRDLLRFKASLQPAGWSRVDAIQATRPRSDRAFVAMWFDKKMDEAYADGIEPALRECGYDGPFRVNDPKHDALVHEAEYQPKIDDRIIAEIRRARFLVVDVTGARPAVYYEAGFAQGLGTPVIWTCSKANEKTDMCFDTRQIGHIIWDDPAHLKSQLVAAIGARGWDRSRPAA